MTFSPFRSLIVNIGRSLLLAVVIGGCAGVPHLFGQKREAWAFTAPWDRRSDASVVEHGKQLDVIVSGWIALDSATGQPLDLFRDTVRRATGARYFALVTSWHNDRFHPEVVLALARNPALLAQVAGTIGRRAADQGYSGLILDFEGHAKRDLTALITVSKAIADSARAHRIAPIAIAIPAADTAGYPAMPMLRFADYVMPMLYDEHWAESPPGPIASPDWVRTTMGIRVAEVGASKIVAALPLYGYKWGRGQPAETIGFVDAQRYAAEAGILLEREPGSQTMRARREGQWELWVADSRLLKSLMTEIAATGVKRFAFWRLGLEDPALWTEVLR